MQGGGLARVAGMLRAAGCTAPVQNRPPASCVEDMHCLRPGCVVPAAGTMSACCSHAGGWSDAVAQPACGAGCGSRALRTAMPWSLRDGGREDRGWLSPEVPGKREMTRRGREGPEVDPVGGEPTITSTACSGRRPGTPWGGGARWP